MEKLLKPIDRAIEYALTSLGLFMVIVGFLQVTSRYLFKNPLVWSEELLRYVFVWLIFLGTALGLRRKVHIRITFITDILPQKIRPWFGLCSDILIMFFTSILLWKSVYLCITQADQLSSALRIPITIPYLAMPVGSVLILLYALADAVNSVKSMRS